MFGRFDAAIFRTIFRRCSAVLLDAAPRVAVLVHEDGTGLRGDVHALPDEEDFSLNGDVLVVTAATYYYLLVTYY